MTRLQDPLQKGGVLLAQGAPAADSVTLPAPGDTAVPSDSASLTTLGQAVLHPSGLYHPCTSRPVTPILGCSTPSPSTTRDPTRRNQCQWLL